MKARRVSTTSAIGTLWQWFRPRLGRDAARQPLPARPRRSGPMQQRYAALVEEMKARHDVRVRKWRTSTTGCAWRIEERSGSVIRMIEAPYPTGPMSCAVFLHEVGHHAIGLGVISPRCLEEYEAWRWSLATMREFGFAVTPAVERRVERSLRYAVAKAKRRGLKRLPAELAAFG